MYFPKSLQIASPYVIRWHGESGRQYEFGVVRSASFRIDQPAVYVLAKHEGNMIVPLSVGQTEGGTPSEWVQALAEGMTHAHLRFEARSEAFRQAEVQDLVAALRPILNEVRASESDLIRLSPDRPVEDATTFRRLSASEAERKAANGGSYADERALWSRTRAAVLSMPRLLKHGVWRMGRMASIASGSKPAQAAADGAADRKTPAGGVGEIRLRVPAPVAVALEGDTAGTLKSVAWDQQGVSGNDDAINRSERHHAERETPPAVEPAASSAPCVSEPSPCANADGAAPDGAVAKAALGLDPGAPVVLFADEVSADAGADILVDAFFTVCHDDRPLEFLFVGDGPLKAELEARVSAAGLPRRPRFLGSLAAEGFEPIFAAADFVIIPARVRRDAALAHRAASAGKPVLVTHQACVDAIVHGKNGLVTYDNPGSLVWGLRELSCCSWSPSG